jgi:hypothetical protein
LTFIVISKIFKILEIMGADSFYNQVKGANASKLFSGEVQNAKYEHGNGGYTGTIAEKSGYTMSRKPKGVKAESWYNRVEDFDSDDKTQKHYHELKHDYNVLEDKWGDALCIPITGGFIFCGCASS